MFALRQPELASNAMILRFAKGSRVTGSGLWLNYWVRVGYQVPPTKFNPFSSLPFSEDWM
jgi:hypothetical protein